MRKNAQTLKKSIVAAVVCSIVIILGLTLQAEAAQQDATSTSSADQPAITATSTLPDAASIDTTGSTTTLPAVPAEVPAVPAAATTTAPVPSIKILPPQKPVPVSVPRPSPAPPVKANAVHATTATTSKTPSPSNTATSTAAAFNQIVPGDSNQLILSNYYPPFDKLSTAATYALSALAMLCGISGALLILREPREASVWRTSNRAEQSLIESST